jgi:hypothetical protein
MLFIQVKAQIGMAGIQSMVLLHLERPLIGSIDYSQSLANTCKEGISEYLNIVGCLFEKGIFTD